MSSRQRCAALSAQRRAAAKPTKQNQRNQGDQQQDRRACGGLKRLPAVGQREDRHRQGLPRRRVDHHRCAELTHRQCDRQSRRGAQRGQQQRQRDPAQHPDRSGAKRFRRLAIGRVEAIEGGLKFTNDGVNAEGKTTHAEWSGKFDGKDNPVKGDANRDTAALKKIDDNTIEISNKKDGKPTTTIRAVFSKDGKTRTQTVKGTNAQGVKVNNTVVYEK